MTATTSSDSRRMDQSDLRFLCSTPKVKAHMSHISHRQSSYSSQQEINDLQANLSQLALENEELKFELEQYRQRCHELDAENQQLHQTVQDQHEIQTKMKKQLNTVTKTVYVIYERFKSLKSRYYQEQFANGGVPGGDEREFAAAPSCSRRFQCDGDADADYADDEPL